MHCHLPFTNAIGLLLKFAPILRLRAIAWKPMLILLCQEAFHYIRNKHKKQRHMCEVAGR